MLIVRDVRHDDLDDLLAVARHLDSVNLPADREVLAAAIERSRLSFSGALPVPSREYLFVLSDLARGGKVVGSSRIFAQHGTPGAPHAWFDVGVEERYSAGLGRRVAHQVLRIGYTFDGPTELGGLVLLPEYRGGAHRGGKLLSYVRLLFIGMHRTWFRDELLAELLPPFEADGTSLVWDSLGARFTGLSYADADRRSREDKEFIRTLFPEGPIYVCLLTPEAQAVLGRVGPATRGVERMLLAAGFHHAKRVDPFDGGPHLTARTDDVAPIRALRRVRIERGDGDLATSAIVAAAHEDGLLAAATSCRLAGDRAVVAPEVADALRAPDGADLWVVPIELAGDDAIASRRP